MTDTNFTNTVTKSDAAWFDDMNDLFYTTMGGVPGAGTITKLQFPATQVPSADPNALDDYEEGTYTATLTGCTTAPTYTVNVTKIGNHITLDMGATTGTSNTTAKTLTGLPAAYRPSTAKRFPVAVSDNGGASVWGLMQLDAGGVMTFWTSAAGAGWTASGTFASQTFSISYTLV